MKTLKYLIEAVIIYFSFLLIKLAGLDLSRKLFAFIFLKIGPIIKSKNITEKNIYRVFGDNIDKKEIVKNMWSNYGKTFAEYMYLKKFRDESFSKKNINIKGLEKLNDIIKNNKPAIFISGHFGNFELMAMQLEKNKINLATIYRPLNNIFLNPLMVFLRRKYICKNQIEKGKKGARKTIEMMKKKFSIALMVDQRLGESERFPFFEEPAHTTTLPAQLALRFNCNIIPIYLERNKDNAFNMEILDPIEINKTNNADQNKKEITIKINQVIEKMILRNPKQWIWTHNRWR